MHAFHSIMHQGFQKGGILTGSYPTYHHVGTCFGLLDLVEVN